MPSFTRLAFPTCQVLEHRACVCACAKKKTTNLETPFTWWPTELANKATHATSTCPSCLGLLTSHLALFLPALPYVELANFSDAAKLGRLALDLPLTSSRPPHPRSLLLSPPSMSTETAVNGTQAAPSTTSPAVAPKDEVGWYFVEQYYTTLSRSPERLHVSSAVVSFRHTPTTLADSRPALLQQDVAVCLWK